MEPRQDIPAEQYVLGAVLATGGRTLDDVELNAEEFYRPVHEQMWTEMLRRRADREPVEPMTLAGQFDAAYLHELLTACATPANVDFYAQRVRACATLRGLQKAAARATEIAERTDPRQAEEALEDARKELDAISQAATPSGSRTLADLWTEALERWETPETTVLSTGWADLDDHLNGGYRPGHLCVVGARPAVGKSVAAAVTATAAARYGVGTLIASAEMPDTEVMDRIAANVAGVELAALTRRELTDDQWRRVTAAFGKSHEWPLRIYDRAPMTVTAIRREARNMARREGLGLVVVDYLQILMPADRRESREQQVSRLTKDLRTLAREFQVPVVALAQVNRGPMSRTEKRPAMSDLRESGAIEADADEVILLHRDDEESPGEIEFIVEKNRHGRTGRVVLAWAPHYSRISDMYRGVAA